MKKLIGLALLTATLFADSSTDPTTEPADAPLDPTTIDPPCAEPIVDQPCVDEPPVVICDEYGSFILTEFKMGYFRFGDRKLRHRYEDGLLDLQLTSSFRFWKPLYAYLGVEYVGSNGRIPRTHTKIKIRMVPVSLGVQYIQPITVDLKYYLTAGARYFFVHQWTHSRSLTHNGVGGFANTGFMYYLNHNIVIDIFGEYSYKKMRFHNMGGNLQVGGMTLGAGIGYFW